MTYILPPAATPNNSSAGSGNGASFTHFPLTCASTSGAIRPTIIEIARLIVSSFIAPLLYNWLSDLF